MLGFVFMVVFLRDLNISSASSVLGGAPFILNPYVLNRISLTDIQAYICLPLILHCFNKINAFNIFNLIKIAIPFLLLGHIGHPEMSVIVSLVSTIYFLCFNGKEFIKKIYFIVLLAIFVFFSLAVYIFPLIENYLKGVSYKNGVSAIYVHTNLKHIFISCYFKLLFWFCVSSLASFGLDAFLKSRKWKSEIVIFIFTFLLMAYMPSLLAFPLKDFFVGLNLFYILSFIPISFIIIKISTREKSGLGENEKIISFIVFLTILPYAYPLSHNLIKWNKCNIKDYDSVNYVKNEFTHSRSVALSLARRSCLPPNYGSIYELRQAEINTFIFPNYFYKILQRHSPFPTIILFKHIDEPLLRKLGVDFIFIPNDIKNLDEKRISFKGKISAVYRVGEDNGRVFFAESAVPLEALKDFSYEDLVSLPPKEVYIEGDWKSELGHLENYSIGFLEDSVHKVSLNVQTDKNSLLVLRDTYDKEWKVYVDGELKKSYLVDRLFRGVEVPEGRHLVEWLYMPKVFYISLFISICFHLIMAVFCFLCVLKKLKLRESNEKNCYYNGKI